MVGAVKTKVTALDVTGADTSNLNKAGALSIYNAADNALLAAQDALIVL
jgi:hypothetical protein